MTQFISLNLVSAAIAFFLDDIFGDPRTGLHPVVLMGRINRFLEKYLYRSGFAGGMLLTVLSAMFWTGLGAALLYFAYGFHIYAFVLLNSVIIYTAVSAKSMKQHAMKVYEPLAGGDLPSARRELSMIVSRDTENMDGAAVVKSAVESVSENYTDGVLSPLFFSVFGGGAGALFFKAASTLDSMIGYRNEKYVSFGKFAARLDDVLNFIPARLSVVIIALSAPFCGMSMKNTLKTVLKYRLAHDSPNSAHSMSAFAGAMSLRLGGPVSYFGKVKDKPFIGEGTGEPEPERIKEAVRLFETAAVFAVALCVAVYFVLRYYGGCPLCA
ncbi:cobalamin biosynthesis protein CobD [Geovibrio thiophilus]|uniref:Cobalamin biosynthesis protein CobD n=1 Tax=Geovibrio thiophilus TaxID=139438 RepID=A0A3R5Y7B1_9BACT|nr:adenosylcobinamide-phosphate synthase CbiB [Geovibrio thiophilus]QAR33453.1 cobalamin biosynthesis protein CobD [Geovibrio thiophilus]